MKKCWQGPRYATEMDMTFGAAEAILAGRRVTHSFVCDSCGGWHLGYPKELEKRCPASGKRIFATHGEADEQLQNTLRKRALGQTNRREQRVYECPPGECGGWHLTSQDSQSV